MITYRDTASAGRGVFACRQIAQGEIIERAPVIVIPPGDLDLIDKTILNSYYFLWGRDGASGAIALGVGSLFNHSANPNADYRKRFAEQIIEFIAIREIQDGEEISINYNGDPNDQTRIVFEGATWRKATP